MNGLQKAANISVIVAASIVSCAMLYRIFLARQDPAPTVSLTPELKGTVLPLGDGNIGGRATALLLVMGTGTDEHVSYFSLIALVGKSQA